MGNHSVFFKVHRLLCVDPAKQDSASSKLSPEVTLPEKCVVVGEMYLVNNVKARSAPVDYCVIPVKTFLVFFRILVRHLVPSGSHTVLSFSDPSAVDRSVIAVWVYPVYGKTGLVPIQNGPLIKGVEVVSPFFANRYAPQVVVVYGPAFVVAWGWLMTPSHH